MDTKKAIPEVSVDTRTLERLLLLAQIGEIVDYSTLSAAIGRNVQTDARHLLRTACNRVRAEPYRMVFGAVPNVGLKRLDDLGKIGKGQSRIGRIRRQAKRAIRDVTAVDDFTALPNDKKIEHNVILAQAGAMRHFTSPKSVKKLATSVSEPQKALPLRQCVEAMKHIV